MATVGELILTAWQRVRQGMTRQELNKRLARRRSKLFRSPPRAWCLAVKASDRRIDDAFGWDPARNKQWTGKQEIELDARLVRTLVRPVTTGRPYSLQRDLARLLGVSHTTLCSPIARGKLTLRRLPLLGGQRGWPVPVVYTKDLLDPGKRGWRIDDPVWGTQHSWLNERVPDDLQQTLIRVPVHVAIGTPRWKKEGRLFRKAYVPPIDPLDVRKWKDGQYQLDKHDLRLARIRELRRIKKLERAGLDPSPITDHDPQAPRDAVDAALRIAPDGNPRITMIKHQKRLQFIGWRWICPDCGKKVKTLFYPLFAVCAWNLLEDDDPPIGSHDGMPRPRAAFACVRCHNLTYSSNTSRRGWNKLITQLSGGLLYGYEVPRPPWYPTSRIKPPARTPLRKSPRSDEVERRLLAGQTFPQIAREMNCTKLAVHSLAHCIYKKRGVKNLTELARKNGIQTTLPGERAARRKRVQELLKNGCTSRQIAADMHLTVPNVCQHYLALYRVHGVKSKHELLQKLGVNAQITGPSTVHKTQPESSRVHASQ